MLKIARTFTLISLFALSLSTMLETQAQANLSIKGCATSAAVCAVTVGVTPNQCLEYFTSTSCHRSGATPTGNVGGVAYCSLPGNFAGAASTCDDLLNGAFRCRQASLDLEKDEFYAAAPETSETDMLTVTSSPEPTLTFAATPGPEQIATFVSMAASDPIILAAAKPPTPLQFVAYLISGDGAGAGNLDTQPKVAIATFRPTAVSVRCFNNGGGDGGNGLPFFPIVSLLKKDIFDPDHLDGRGNWDSTIPFTIENINAAISIPDNACKDKWRIIPDSTTVLTAIIDLVVADCTESTCTGITIPADRWAQNCTYNSDGTDSCTTIFHCKDLDTAEEREACLGQSLP